MQWERQRERKREKEIENEREREGDRRRKTVTGETKREMLQVSVGAHKYRVHTHIDHKLYTIQGMFIDNYLNIRTHTHTHSHSLTCEGSAQMI